jgi:hypothetical protein
VDEGHYPGARYDYRIAWGDGSADLAPARTTATSLNATHRYTGTGTSYPLVASIEDAARGKSHTIRADVRVVPRAVYDQPAPSIRVSPAVVSFQAAPGGGDVPPRAVALANAGAFPVSWSAASDGQWLTVVPSEGVLQAGQTAILSLAAATAGLVDGEHSASVIVTAPGAAGSPQVVSATLLIGESSSTSELVIADRVSGYRAFGNHTLTLTTAQTFVAPSAAIHGIAVGLSRAGNPAHAVTASIRRTPTGPDLATVQLAAVTSTDFRAPSWMVGTFSAPVVTVAGDPYVLVLRVPAASSTQHYRWSVDTQNPYPDGMVQVETKPYLFLDALARIIHAQP